MKYNKAFSLVEISMVLIIIALILASIMASGSLLQSYKIKKTVNEINDLRGAINAFKTEFKALPGDFNQAATFWSGGINGNDNGFIGTYDINHAESVQAFYQLSQAGLISGSYATTFGSSGVIPGLNTAKTAYSSNAVINFFADAIYEVYPVGNSLRISYPYDSPDGREIIAVLHAYHIDNKYDDGKPGLGEIFTMTYSSGNCINLNPGEATYNKSTAYYILNSTAKCVIQFGVAGYAYH